MGLSENRVSGKTRSCVPCGVKRNRSSKYSTAKNVSIYCISTSINVRVHFKRLKKRMFRNFRKIVKSLVLHYWRNMVSTKMLLRLPTMEISEIWRKLID